MDSNNINRDRPAVAGGKEDSETIAETRAAEQEPTSLDSGNEKNDDNGAKEDNKDKDSDQQEKDGITAAPDGADAADKASSVGDEGSGGKGNEGTAEGAGASPAKNTRAASSASASSPQEKKVTKPAATRKSNKGQKSPKELGLAPLGPAPKPAIPIRARRELRKLFFSLTDQQFEYEVLHERQRRIALAVEATASATKTAAASSKRKRDAEDTSTATSPRKKRGTARDGQYFIPGMPGVYPAQPIVTANVAKLQKKGRSGKAISIDASAGFAAHNKPFTPKQLINEQKWEERYQQLQEFKTKYGHINVTNSHDSQLRKWLSRQRQEWKKVYDDEQKEMSMDDDGKRRNPKPSATMTRDKIMKLALIGVGSLQNGPARSMGNVNRGLKEWDVKYEELVAFKNEFGHCNVSRSAHKHTHGALANWVGTQRLKFQNRQLQLQKNNNGVADGDDEVSSSDEDENLDAALDEETRKKNKAKRKKSKLLAKRRKERLVLTDEQMTKLASIGFVFKIHSDWEERFQQIVEYKAKYGHTRVPVAFEGYNKLGRWVNTIKTLYHSSNPKKRNQLSDERIAKLNTIQFDWELRSGPFPNRVHGMSKQSANKTNNNNLNNSSTNNPANPNNSNNNTMNHNIPISNLTQHLTHAANPNNALAANNLPHPLHLQQQQQQQQQQQRHIQHDQTGTQHHPHHQLPPNPNNYYYEY